MARLTLLAVVLLASSAAHAAPGFYEFDQRHGAIGFKVGHFGLFTSEGGFERFHGRLVVDPARLEDTRVEVTIDAASVAIAVPEAATMLKTPAYFDVTQHPAISFRATSVERRDDTHFHLRGQLRIRGITREQAMEIAIVDRHADGPGSEVADVVASGEVSRGDFGMVADRGFIEDVVRLRISMRIRIGAPANGG